METDRGEKSTELIIPVLPLRKNSQSQTSLTSRNVNYLHRSRVPAETKKGKRFKKSQEGNSECISISSVLSISGSRTKEDPGAEETYDLSKENNRNE